LAGVTQWGFIISAKGQRSLYYQHLINLMLLQVSLKRKRDPHNRRKDRLSEAVLARLQRSMTEADQCVVYYCRRTAYSYFLGSNLAPIPANLMQMGTDAIMDVDLSEDVLSDLDDPLPKKPRTEADQRRWDKKKAKRATFLPNGDVSPYKLKSLDAEAESMVRKAEVNCSQFLSLFLLPTQINSHMTAIFPTFNFLEVAKHGARKRPPYPKTIITWNDNNARMAKSGDLYKLVIYLPRGIPASNVVN
jgi:hypothetical protein